MPRAAALLETVNGQRVILSQIQLHLSAHLYSIKKKASEMFPLNFRIETEGLLGLICFRGFFLAFSLIFLVNVCTFWCYMGMSKIT